MDQKTFEMKCDDIVKWLEKEFSGIRSGQANPSLLDSIRVPNYGAQVPLNQVCSISVEDARTLRLSVWDGGTIGQIETAINESDLGLSLVTDSGGIRVIFPELTSERRSQLIKLAKQKLEDSRISIRSARDEIMKYLDQQHKQGEISEDQRYAGKDLVQKKVEEVNRTLENLYDRKTEELNK